MSDLKLKASQFPWHPDDHLVRCVGGPLAGQVAPADWMAFSWPCGWYYGFGDGSGRRFFTWRAGSYIAADHDTWWRDIRPVIVQINGDTLPPPRKGAA